MMTDAELREVAMAVAVQIGEAMVGEWVDGCPRRFFKERGRCESFENCDACLADYLLPTLREKLGGDVK